MLGFVRYTLLDNRTRIPVTREPAKNGPTQPRNTEFYFLIEDTQRSGKPVMYGTADMTKSLEAGVLQISEAEFFEAWKKETMDRARAKRVQAEQGGIEIGGAFVRTDIESQNRISALVTTLSNTPELESIDFEATHGNWIELDRDTAIGIGKAVALHVQSCFTWCKGIHQQIGDLGTLNLDNYDSLQSVLDAINAFGSI